MKNFKKGGLAWIVYHHEVVKAEIVSIDEKEQEIGLQYYDCKEGCLWVGIRRFYFNCFDTKEEAEKYQEKIVKEWYGE